MLRRQRSSRFRLTICPLSPRRRCYGFAVDAVSSICTSTDNTGYVCTTGFEALVSHLRTTGSGSIFVVVSVLFSLMFMSYLQTPLVFVSIHVMAST